MVLGLFLKRLVLGLFGAFFGHSSANPNKYYIFNDCHIFFIDSTQNKKASRPNIYKGFWCFFVQYYLLYTMSSIKVIKYGCLLAFITFIQL